MRKIIDFFKKLFGIKKEEVKPVVVSKPKPKRKGDTNGEPSTK